MIVRCTCGPPIPGEFDYTGYPRPLPIPDQFTASSAALRKTFFVRHDSGDHRSAPSRPSSQKVTDEDV